MRVRLYEYSNGLACRWRYNQFVDVNSIANIVRSDLM